MSVQCCGGPSWLPWAFACITSVPNIRTLRTTLPKYFITRKTATLRKIQLVYCGYILYFAIHVLVSLFQLHILELLSRPMMTLYKARDSNEYIYKALYCEMFWLGLFHSLRNMSLRNNFETNMNW